MCAEQIPRSAYASTQSDQSKDQNVLLCGLITEPPHEISNNVLCATSKASDQPAMSVKLLTEHHLEFLSFKGGCTGSYESTIVKMSHCLKSHVAAQSIFAAGIFLI